MMSAIVTIGGFGLPTLSLFIFAGFLVFLFLYWRAAKHEFVDEEIIFDTLVICTISALFSARVFEFITHPALYRWSIANFFFLNTISGLNLWGALFGTILAGKLYLRNKKYNFWQIFDLAAAPLALFLSIYKLGLFLGSEGILTKREFLKNIPDSVFQAILFFVLFWVLKRLEKQKKHVGFFTSFFIVFFSFINLSAFYLGQLGFLKHAESAYFFSVVSYLEIFAGIFLFFGIVSWYILAKRKPKGDIKGLLAFCLLLIFRFKRSVTSVSEADQIAKAVVLLPYNLGKLILKVFWMTAKEIISGFVDFAHALGLKNDKY